MNTITVASWIGVDGPGRAAAQPPPSPVFAQCQIMADSQVLFSDANPTSTYSAGSTTGRRRWGSSSRGIMGF